MNATSVDEEFNPSVHVYEPHKVGLPALRPYFKALWQRREFAAEMSRTNIRAANTNTFFGQIWLVLNPLLLAPIFLVMLTVFAAGMGMIFAALQVYFRDTTSFLPYFVRIWLYLSPVLWFAEQAPPKFKGFIQYNPLYSLIGGWADLLVRGDIPKWQMWAGAGFFAIAAF